MSEQLTVEEREIEHGWVNPWWTHVRIRTSNNEKGYWEHPRDDVFILNDRCYIKDKTSNTCFFADLRRCKFVQVVEWSDEWRFKELP